MKYILVGWLLGSLITSEHDTREACEGRAVILREAKVTAKCVDLNISGTSYYGTSGNLLLCSNTSCSVPVNR